MESNNIVVIRLGRNLPLTGNRRWRGSGGGGQCHCHSRKRHGFMGASEVHRFLAVSEEIEEE